MRSPVGLPALPDLAVIAVHAGLRLMLWWIYVQLPYAWKGLAWGDLGLYTRWAGAIAESGAVPAEVSWMYPPGAAGVLSAIGAVPAHYPTVFITCLVVIDAAVLALLLSGDRHRAGGWAWAVLPPVLGLISWARLDMLPVAAAAATVLWAATRPRLAGVLAALGAAVKAWPILLGLLYLRNRVLLLSAVVTGLASAAIATVALDGAWDFALRLAGRGVQVESVLATPWLVRQALGHDLDGGFSNGSFEIFEPGAVAVARIGSVIVVALVSLAWWLSRGRHPAVRWWAMVMALLSASPLLSTQFILWLIGACAVAATLRDRDGRLARRALPSLALIAALSHAGFPIHWFDLTADGNTAALIVVVRNVLLVATTTWLLVTLGRALPQASTPAHPRPAPAGVEPIRPMTTPPRPAHGPRHLDVPPRPVSPTGQ